VITDIIQLVAPGEHVNIKIESLVDGRVRATIVPRLGEEPAKASDEVKELRELLSTPLVLTDLPETLAGHLQELVTGAAATFTAVREQIDEQLQNLEKKAADLAPTTTRKPPKVGFQTPQKPERGKAASVQAKQDDASSDGSTEPSEEE
jgi:hypothetical protein